MRTSVYRIAAAASPSREPKFPWPSTSGSAHGPVLRHAHDRVVHGRIAVRMIFTDHITDHARGFLVGAVVRVAQLAHGEQHAPMHGFETVARVRQGAPDDHAHGVVDVGGAHLLFDEDRADIPSSVWRRP
jgi:hypothetical protein